MQETDLPHQNFPQQDKDVAPAAPTLLIASPHRYPDLAQLWYRFVRRELMPAFTQRGLAVTVTIFCDGEPNDFNPDDFLGASLCLPGPEARDFMEFYDFALNEKCDFLLILDADAFVLDGEWVAGYLQRFSDQDVSAVSFVPRKGKEGPAIYALLCRCAHYRALPAPVFPSHYESLEEWPKVVNLQPGDFAAQRLLAAGRKIISVGAEESALHVTNFHGTTVVRICRSLFGSLIGDSQFEDLIQRERYYAVGVYDNILLASLYERLFDSAFAPDSLGHSLAGSMTISAFRRVLGNIHDPKRQSALRDWFEHSNLGFMKMAACEGLDLALPAIVPENWAKESA
ncbi:MAG TPA: hypothetical protein VKZ53_15590 [Candidatus Angelobacter sp.]|nr:hypothetical protein [Candidatus Angelobacter sp.]